MSEIPNTSYEEPINNDSLNNQNEGLNQEKSSPKTVEDYIAEQKKLLLEITDESLQEHAQEEFQEVQEKFEALRGDTSDVAALQLADLQQEFQRDINGMERLDDNKLSELLSEEEVKQLSSYINTQGEQTEENFYSILSNMSDAVFQSIIIEFQKKEYFEGDSLLQPELMESFVKHILTKHENKIEQQEITELINLDISTITSKTQVAYYKQHILSISKHAQPDEQKQLNKIMEKLNILIISEVSAEKGEVSAEKGEVSAEKIRKTEKLIEDYDKAPNEIKNKYPQLIDAINSIKNNLNTSNLEASINKLESVLLSPINENSKTTIAEKFLQDLGKVNPELYADTLISFKGLSEDLNQRLSHLPTIYGEPKEAKPFPVGGDTEIFSALSPNATISGDRAIDGNKYMDLSVEPPQKYIRLENGFRLNSTVKFPKIITEKEQEFTQEREILEKNISDGKADYNIKSLRKNELLQAKEKLDSSETSVDEKNQLKLKYNNLESELSQLITEMNQLDSDIKLHENKLAEITKEFNYQHKHALDWYKAQVEAKDKKTEEVLKFLEGVGFNLIPQSITNAIIEQLNNPGNSGLRGLIGFNTLLNLSEGDLGFQTTFNDDTLGTTEKVIFAEFINRMISADSGKPIDVNKILKGGSVAVGDRIQLSIQLEQAGLKDSGTGIGTAMDNLRKSTLEKNNS